MEKAKFFEKKKFMWDGMTYESETEVLPKKSEYEKENFITRVIQEDGKFFLFTQRVVTEIEVQNQ